jgi:hypothetical protein
VGAPSLHSPAAPLQHLALTALRRNDSCCAVQTCEVDDADWRQLQSCPSRPEQTEVPPIPGLNSEHSRQAAQSVTQLQSRPIPAHVASEADGVPRQLRQGQRGVCCSRRLCAAAVAVPRSCNNSSLRISEGGGVEVATLECDSALAYAQRRQRQVQGGSGSAAWQRGKQCSCVLACRASSHSTDRATLIAHRTLH